MYPPGVGVEAGPEEIAQQINGDEQADEKRQDASSHDGHQTPAFGFRQGK
jgi:hypothetical protein